jgi:hypothetical protein
MIRTTMMSTPILTKQIDNETEHRNTCERTFRSTASVWLPYHNKNSRIFPWPSSSSSSSLHIYIYICVCVFLYTRGSRILSVKVFLSWTFPSHALAKKTRTNRVWSHSRSIFLFCHCQHCLSSDSELSEHSQMHSILGLKNEGEDLSCCHSLIVTYHVRVFSRC